MTDIADEADSAPDSKPDDDLRAVEVLVGDWLTVPDLGDQLRSPLSAARRLLDDRSLLSLRIGERGIRSVPARFIRDGEVLETLKGTFTVLADGGMNDLEIIRWIFTPHDGLRLPGAPIDSLLAGSTKEVRRLAMELAF